MRENALLKKALKNVAIAAGKAGHDPYRPGWHLSPAAGLLNDPNGFIQFDGRYHLFYQWNPLACAHGAKWWGHWSSDDLTHWQHEPVALLPGEVYDVNGCYSGSAVNDNGTLCLLYTGNVKLPGSRTAWQCLATVQPDGEVTKAGPVIGLPEGYTGHVRDPKVWRHGPYWYMVLGAQNLQEQGKVLLYRGETLRQWTLSGEIAGSHLNGLGEFGYMWECPDLFALDGQDVLLVCPQGLPAKEQSWLNTHQSGYFVGRLEYEHADFTHGDFHELDLGFEFYAPQTTLSDDGRRLLFGWVGVPDADEFYQPTAEYGWMHMMSCPRELHLVNGKIIQQPVKELQSLRGEHTRQQGCADDLAPLAITQAELVIASQGEWQAHLAGALTLTCTAQGLTLHRINCRTGEPETRYWSGQVNHLHIFCDHSIAEIFINHGEATMTSRYFPAAEQRIHWQGRGQLTVEHWQLESSMVV
ncbi:MULTISPECIES: sucrose-6-phosphate hydrolase [Yersiniaceae]|uniref:sucrose-6-phosphate hydrolase n=1 Tax=Yersiniaceae TaxID=1903411 RepID=UPI0009326AA3|nr:MULTISPECIES: sucrose-6-phosphate hydrolase [Yersiniaceae]PLR32752.1 glycosyl hydrolase family 32 [Chimaeribacter arupi]PLR49739.1 glycosyl hydrolase family 32 [Chimaeribacter arupi]